MDTRVKMKKMGGGKKNMVVPSFCTMEDALRRVVRVEKVQKFFEVLAGAVRCPAFGRKKIEFGVGKKKNIFESNRGKKKNGW